VAVSDLDRFNEWRRSSTESPHFLVVCNHGVHADHSDCDHIRGCQHVARIGWLRWFPNSGHWWAVEDDDSILVTALDGNDPGDDPWDILGEPEPAGGDPNRTKLELICPEPGCRTFDFRPDDAMLQDTLEAVVELIQTQPDFSTAYTPSGGESRVVVTLQGLHIAARHAAKR